MYITAQSKINAEIAYWVSAVMSNFMKDHPIAVDSIEHTKKTVLSITVIVDPPARYFLSALRLELFRMSHYQAHQSQD